MLRMARKILYLLKYLLTYLQREMYCHKRWRVAAWVTSIRYKTFEKLLTNLTHIAGCHVHIHRNLSA